MLGFIGAVERNPRALGQRHPAWESAEIWVYQSPNIARIPAFAILYEIDDAKGVVVLWRFNLI